MNAPPIQPLKQCRQLRSRQSHHAVFDLRPAEVAILQPLGKQAQTRAIPEDQLDPVRTLGAEHIDRPRERVGRHGLAHQRCQSLGAFAEVDRLGRYHYPDRARRADHAPAFDARSTALTVFTSAPRPTRTITPPISTSIVPAPGSALHCWALRWRRTADAGEATSTTAGTHCSPSPSESPARDSRICRRQPNNCCGDNPCRLATPETESPLVTISATIRALSSLLHERRRPEPVKTSTRRAGSVIALCTVSILSLAVRPNRRLADHGRLWKVSAEHRLQLVGRIVGRRTST